MQGGRDDTRYKKEDGTQKSAILIYIWRYYSFMFDQVVDIAILRGL